MREEDFGSPPFFVAENLGRFSNWFGSSDPSTFLLMNAKKNLLPVSAAGAVLLLVCTSVAGSDSSGISQWKVEAAHGDAEAEFQLGRTYYRGEGVSQDFHRAFSLFRKSAEQGNAKAMTNLGAMYFLGHGTPINHAASLQWYRRGAESGAALAQDHLGNLLLAGKETPKNAVTALHWFEKAADQGLVQGQLDLGQLYLIGDVGVNKNEELAKKWLMLAAQSGNSSAENSLGALSELHLGTVEANKAAVDWYTAAAVQGDAKGQSNLGRVYAEGIATRKDLVQAYKWLALSANHGESTAIHFLNGMKDELSPQQLAEARKAVADFRPVFAHPKNLPSDSTH